MLTDRIKEIANHSLNQALLNSDHVIIAEVIQRDCKCSSDDINLLKDILKPFGDFIGSGFGELEWKLFRLNAAGIEFVENGGIIRS